MEANQIKKINDVLAQINPMVGMVDLLAQGLISLFKKYGRNDEADLYEDELLKYRTAINNLRNSIAEFNSQHGQ